MNAIAWIQYQIEYYLMKKCVSMGNIQVVVVENGVDAVG